MTMKKEDIEKMIKNEIPDAKIKIDDLRGDNNHYCATITSKSFIHKSLIFIYLK